MHELKAGLCRAHGMDREARISKDAAFAGSRLLPQLLPLSRMVLGRSILGVLAWIRGLFNGILTKFVGSTIEKILKQIEARPEGAALSFALTVLMLSEEGMRALSDGIDGIINRARRDGKGHDFTMGVGSGPNTGITVHCSEEPRKSAFDALRSHCEKRKYLQKPTSWFGICVDRQTQVRFGIGLRYLRQQNSRMDQLVSEFPDSP